MGPSVRVAIVDGPRTTVGAFEVCYLRHSVSIFFVLFFLLTMNSLCRTGEADWDEREGRSAVFALVLHILR